MILAFHHHPGHHHPGHHQPGPMTHWWFDAGHPNRRTALITLAGIAAIVAAVAIAAVAGHAGVGPDLGAVVYLIVGLAALVLWVTYMITWLKGALTPGLSYIGLWTAALIVTYLLFYAFG